MLPASLKRYAWLSIGAAVATILLKGWAWWLTGSVGLLSDALESFVNLAGALMALAMLSSLLGMAGLPAAGPLMRGAAVCARAVTCVAHFMSAPGWAAPRAVRDTSNAIVRMAPHLYWI